MTISKAFPLSWAAGPQATGRPYGGDAEQRSQAQLSGLTKLLLAPLLFSLVLAVVVSFALDRLTRRNAVLLRGDEGICVCAETEIPSLAYAANPIEADGRPAVAHPVVGRTSDCEDRRAASCGK